MAYEFKQLGAVESVESVGETANVLIEENGTVKKVAKSSIGAQADWNETDETSPAFIMNKPESMGAGITWFCASWGAACEGTVWDANMAFTNGNPIVDAFNKGRVGIVYSNSGSIGYSEMAGYNFYEDSGSTGVNIYYRSTYDNYYLSLGWEDA